MLLARPPVVPWLAKILDQGSSFTQLDLSKVHKKMFHEGFFVWSPIAEVSVLSLIFTPDTVSKLSPKRLNNVFIA